MLPLQRGSLHSWLIGFEQRQKYEAWGICEYDARDISYVVGSSFWSYSISDEYDCPKGDRFQGGLAEKSPAQKYQSSLRMAALPVSYDFAPSGLKHPQKPCLRSAEEVNHKSQTHPKQLESTRMRKHS
eukprot:592038-Amphidinium_carterae.2